jgi:hypothetical protein
MSLIYASVPHFTKCISFTLNLYGLILAVRNDTILNITEKKNIMIFPFRLLQGTAAISNSAAAPLPRNSPPRSELELRSTNLKKMSALHTVDEATDAEDSDSMASLRERFRYQPWSRRGAAVAEGIAGGIGSVGSAGGIGSAGSTENGMYTNSPLNIL